MCLAYVNKHCTNYEIMSFLGLQVQITQQFVEQTSLAKYFGLSV